MDPIMNLFKILSDETRFRILHLLSKQELCVCELVELLDLSQPKISKHIAKIRSINAVKTKRNEQFIYYSLNTDDKQLISLLESIYDLYKGNETLQKDANKLDSVESFVCNR